MSGAWMGLAAGFLIAVVTAPVGVSGAVFLLPVQLSVFQVPNPAVTPTNLLYNVIAAPGALWRYRRQDQLGGRLARHLIAGSVPGVVLGAIVRVHVLADPRTFRLLAGAVLVPLGGWLLRNTFRDLRQASRDQARTVRRADWPVTAVAALAFGSGLIGGVYGIGGGSVVAPVLAAAGMSVSVVAPAALAATWVTSMVGSATFTVLAVGEGGAIAPHWLLGIACGVGGLIGGYVGARLQPRLPETLLRVLLGVVAAAIGIAYIAGASVTA